MYVGLTISLTAHVMLLGWALISFQATPPLKIPDAEPVEVALITDDDLVRLTKGDRSSKKLKTRAAKQVEKAPVKKAAKKPVIKTVQPPPSAEPPPTPDDIAKKLASLEPPKPAGPTLEELAAKAAKEAAAEKQKAAEKAAAELALKKAAEEEKKKKAEAEKKKNEEARRKKAKKEAERKRKAAEAKRKKREAEKRRKKREANKRARRLAEKRRRERERKKKQSFEGRMAALLNKVPDSKAPLAGSPDPNTDRKLPRGAQAGAPEGRDTRLTASQASLLGSIMKREVARCWNINSGLEGIDRIVIDIEIRLRPDGRLDGQPRVVSRGRGAIFQDAANNAMRALVQCEPYKLPKQFYKGGWDHMVVTFDPQKMF
ncbi:MAG: cell envelope integrity protein TolA [Hyphomicrobiaceae bacterium]